MSEFFNKIKNWLLGVVAFAASVFAILFLFERNKNAVDEALLKQHELNENLEKLDHQIDNNNEALKTEEAKRAELAKEKPNDASIIDIIKYLSNRK